MQLNDKAESHPDCQGPSCSYNGRIKSTLAVHIFARPLATVADWSIHPCNMLATSKSCSRKRESNLEYRRKKRRVSARYFRAQSLQMLIIFKQHLKCIRFNGKKVCNFQSKD